MAEVVYKKISELDNATVPLSGSELIGVSATAGVSKKASIEGMHGSGWWTVLKAALSSFVAPEATHAVDSDTCGTEAPADFHDAAQLTGAIYLDRIPVELTGKNAETATTAESCSGNAATASNSSALDGIDSLYFARIFTVGYNFPINCYGIEVDFSGNITAVKHGLAENYTVPASRIFIGCRHNSE